jgi:acetyl-CoA C-acetyltransferase
MNAAEEIVILDGARTPIGSFGGVLKDVPGFELRDLELGIVTMCIGGGQALAALFRRV